MFNELKAQRKLMFDKHLVNPKQKVHINAQGTKYETYESTLQLYPETLLGDPLLRSRHYSTQLKAYYFDVKPELFEAVLFFYQSNGILSKPTFSSDVEFKMTLQLFGLIKSNKYKGGKKENWSLTYREHAWKILEHPHLSKPGMYFAYVSFAIILISVAMFCFETEMHRGKVHPSHDSRRTTVWFISECLYMTFFTIEYLLRLWGSPQRLKFTISFLGLIDLLAIVPFYLALSISFYSKITNFRILRLLQILRIIKLSRYNSGLKILAQAILSCRRQITSLAILFMITIVFVSTFVYVAEYEAFQDLGFSSIPETMWFAVISMTTVGYGDVVPITPLGKLSGAIGIFMGTVVLFHLFLPIYLMHFSTFYSREQEKVRLELEAKHHSGILKGFLENSRATPAADIFRKRTITYSPAGSSTRSKRHSYSGSMNSINLDPEDGNFTLAVPVRSLTGRNTTTNFLL